MKKLINWEKEKREFKIDIYMFIGVGLIVLLYAISKYMELDKLTFILSYYLAGWVGLGLFYIIQRFRYNKQLKGEKK